MCSVSLLCFGGPRFVGAREHTANWKGKANIGIELTPHMEFAPHWLAGWLQTKA